MGRPAGPLTLKAIEWLEKLKVGEFYIASRATRGDKVLGYVASLINNRRSKEGKHLWGRHFTYVGFPRSNRYLVIRNDDEHSDIASGTTANGSAAIDWSDNIHP